MRTFPWTCHSDIIYRIFPLLTAMLASISNPCTCWTSTCSTRALFNPWLLSRAVYVIDLVFTNDRLLYIVTVTTTPITFCAHVWHDVVNVAIIWNCLASAKSQIFAGYLSFNLPESVWANYAPLSFAQKLQRAGEISIASLSLTLVCRFAFSFWRWILTAVGTRNNFFYDFVDQSHCTCGIALILSCACYACYVLLRRAFTVSPIKISALFNFWFFSCAT